MLNFISDNWLVITLIFGVLYILVSLIEKKRSGK